MSQDQAPQTATKALNYYETRAVALALRVMESALTTRDVLLDTPSVVRNYLSLLLFREDVEVFYVLLLDSRHRLIEARPMFRGTLNQTAVYPREIVRAALLSNAAAVILAHNHPSGVPQPSLADRTLTQAIRTALATVDVATLDHVVVAGSKSLSFADHGWMN